MTSSKKKREASGKAKSHSTRKEPVPPTRSNAGSRAKPNASEPLAYAVADLFQKAFRASPVAMVISREQDGRLVELNEAFARLCGYDREELIGRTSIEAGLIEAEERKRHLKVLSQCGVVRERELLLRSKGGVERWVLASADRVEIGGEPCVFWTGFDITKGKAAEEEVRSVALFPEENPFPVMRVSADGLLLFANRSSAGVLREWQCDPGERLPEQLRAAVHRTLAIRKAQTLEVDVNRRTVSFVLVPIAERGYVNFYGRDVTEQKQAQETLKQRERRLESDLNALTRMHELSGKMLGAEGLYPLLQEIMDAAVEILDADRGTLQLLEGESLRIVAHHGHSTPFLKFFASAETRASVCGEATKRGDRVMVPDVEESPIFSGTESLAILREAGVRAVQSTPMMSRGGKLLGILTTQWSKPYSPDEQDLWRIDLLARQAADLIEHAGSEEVLKRSEGLVRSVIETVPDPIYAKDVESRLVLLNTAALKVVGKPAELILGRNDIEFYDDPAVGQLILENDKRVMGTGVTEQFEENLLTPEGYRDFLDTKAPWRDADGRVIGIVGVSRDITEKKRAEAQLTAELERLVAERTEKLEELVGELEHFSYTITHDMRAPLRAMKGFGSLVNDLCASCEHQDRKEFIGRIITAADRMDALIRDALNYSQAVRQELPLDSVDAEKLLRGMLDSYPEFQRSKAHIHIEGKLPILYANEAGLIQCFSNLLGNAVKFAHPGSIPEIRVTAERRDAQVRIWIEDNGIGIRKEMLPRIFDMFVRGQNTHEGTGIGLALVRKVVNRMRGKVGVESEEGNGSRFWLELKQAGDAHKKTRGGP